MGAGMIPGDGAVTVSPEERPFLGRTNDPRNLLVDYEMGGASLGASSEGLQVQPWELRYADGDFVLSSETTPPTVLFSRPDVTEVSLAFDQTMRPCVSFVQEGEALLWWYDTQAGDMVFTPVGAGVQNPRVCLDEKRSHLLADSDIILSYIRDRSLCYRQQRDRFAIERVLLTGVDRLTIAGMSRGNRMQWRLRVVPD